MHAIHKPSRARTCYVFLKPITQNWHRLQVRTSDRSKYLKEAIYGRKDSISFMVIEGTVHPGKEDMVEPLGLWQCRGVGISSHIGIEKLRLSQKQK